MNLRPETGCLGAAVPQHSGCAVRAAGAASDFKELLARRLGTSRQNLKSGYPGSRAKDAIMGGSSAAAETTASDPPEPQCQWPLSGVPLARQPLGGDSEVAPWRPLDASESGGAGQILSSDRGDAVRRDPGVGHYYGPPAGGGVTSRAHRLGERCDLWQE